MRRALPLASLVALASCAQPALPLADGSAPDLAPRPGDAQTPPDLAPGLSVDLAPGPGDAASGDACGPECCTADTPCDATRDSDGVHFCRSIDGLPYAWLTTSDVVGSCDQAGQVCVSIYACGGTTGTCKAIPNGWGPGACACGDGTCSAPLEDHSSCPADCP